MESSKKTLWSIVSFVKDSPKNIRQFVSYHLGIGVHHMYLFFDDPNDKSAQMLSHLDRVTVFRCDEEFWMKIGDRAKFNRHGVRQNKATTFGYTIAEGDWVLNLDSDEYLHAQMSDLLDNIADDKLAVRLRPAEKVYLNGEMGRMFFRLPMEKRDVRQVHGKFAPNFVRRSGFFGHMDGKTFTRNNLEGVFLKAHSSHWPDGSTLDFVNITASGDCCILHCNAEDFEGWRKKLTFRLGTSSMPGPLRDMCREFVDSGDLVNLRTVYESIFYLTNEQRLKMDELGALFELELALDRFVSDYFPSNLERDG